MSIPTSEDALDVDVTRLRRGVVVRRVGVAVLALFVAAAALGWFGLRTRTIRTSAGEVSAQLEYTAIARRGITTPWQLTIRRTGGLPKTVDVAVSLAYLDALQMQRVSPDPSDATTTSDAEVWTFSTAGNDTLVVSLDANTDPQTTPFRHKGTVTVRAGTDVATLHFTTMVVP